MNNKETKEKKKLPEEENEERELGGQMSFLEHLGELRERIIRIVCVLTVTVIVCFMYSDYLLEILVAPVPVFVSENTQAEKGNNGEGTIESATAAASEDLNLITSIIKNKQRKGVELMVTNPVQGLIVMFKVSIVAGLFVTFPYLFYEIWMFISPGLYKRERRLLLPIIFSSWACFIFGGLFCYFFIFRYALEFLYNFTPTFLVHNWIISEFINFELRMILAFAIVFEEPVVIFLLAKMGFVTSETLRRVRPYAIVGMITLAALITPPDPVSQISCGVPLVILYELSIFLVKGIEKKREASAY